MMGEFETAEGIMQMLMRSLGNKGEQYIILMNKWFNLVPTRKELENEFKNCLTKDQLHLHNQLMFKICENADSVETLPTWNNNGERCSSYINNTFEPIDPIFYEVTERQVVNADLPPFISQERLIPDRSTMIVRATFAAWEHGLKGASLAVANLLSYATQQFLRNIIMAVIRKRKGCNFKNNGFVHSLGKSCINPLLTSVINKPHQEEFQGLQLDPNVKEIQTPALRPNEEELQELFSLAASDAPSTPLAPISVNDVIYTLKLHPSLVASYFTKTVNTERMFARIACSDDD